MELSSNKYCTVGAHGYSHLPLTSLSAEEARNEIINSKKWLEDELGREINHMSYPHGAYNRNIMKIVDDIGFISAATSNAGANTKNQNRLELNRTTILSHDNIYHFANKLNGKLGLDTTNIYLTKISIESICKIKFHNIKLKNF